jgi:predicted nucleic acid-binding protein
VSIEIDLRGKIELMTIPFPFHSPAQKTTPPCHSTSVLGELFFGFMKGSRQQFNEKKLRQVVTRLKIEVIDVNTDVARKCAMIYLSLQKKGNKIPIHDVWIAACCMEVGGTLLTRDKHFELVDQIEAMVLR